jgi:hypothetical protein
MSGDVREYEYRPRWSTIALGVVFFGFCTAFFVREAVNNDRGVIINGIIELGRGGATALYWVLASLSGGFVVAAAFLAVLRMTSRQRLSFGATSARVPASRWSSDVKEIAYRDIVSLSDTTTSGQRFLNVVQAESTYTIVASMLPSDAEFEEVRELLAARVREAQTVERNFSDLKRNR